MQDAPKQLYDVRGRRSPAELHQVLFEEELKVRFGGAAEPYCLVWVDLEAKGSKVFHEKWERLPEDGPFANQGEIVGVTNDLEAHLFQLSKKRQEK